MAHGVSACGQKTRCWQKEIHCSPLKSYSGLGQNFAKSAFESRNVAGVAFPDYMHIPAEALELTANFPVTGDVAGEFCRPEFNACLRSIGVRAASMPVPKASMYQEGEPPPGQDYVGRARQIATVNPKTGPDSMQNSPYGEFGSRIPRPDAGHHGASLGRDWAVGPRLCVAAAGKRQ